MTDHELTTAAEVLAEARAWREQSTDATPKGYRVTDMASAQAAADDARRAQNTIAESAAQLAADIAATDAAIADVLAWRAQRIADAQAAHEDRTRTPLWVLAEVQQALHDWWHARTHAQARKVNPDLGPDQVPGKDTWAKVTKSTSLVGATVKARRTDGTYDFEDPDALAAWLANVRPELTKTALGPKPAITKALTVKDGRAVLDGEVIPDHCKVLVPQPDITVEVTFDAMATTPDPPTTTPPEDSA